VLRYREKEDFESRQRQVDDVVEKWRQAEAEALPSVVTELREKLLIGLIYHDAAIEGEVLSHGEIKAAIDTNIISDISLIPSYEEISNFSRACAAADELAKQKKKPVKLDTLRDLYAILAPNQVEGGLPFRKENPLHRLYYHDICPPEKIAFKMKKLGEWLESDETKELAPIERATKFHWRFMAIFPWANHSGRTARLVANLILEQAGYPLAIIHSIDRQRYYESLRSANSKQLLSLYLESVETTAASALRVYEEAAKVRPPRGKRASASHGTSQG
jgi:Fic family protein